MISLKLFKKKKKSEKDKNKIEIQNVYFSRGNS